MNGVNAPILIVATLPKQKSRYVNKTSRVDSFLIALYWKCYVYRVYTFLTCIVNIFLKHNINNSWTSCIRATNSKQILQKILRDFPNLLSFQVNFGIRLMKLGLFSSIS